MTLDNNCGGNYLCEIWSSHQTKMKNNWSSHQTKNERLNGTIDTDYYDVSACELDVVVALWYRGGTGFIVGSSGISTFLLRL